MMENTNIKKEFADFAYVVSHDLGAPLRHIREFTRLLLGNLTPHIGNEEKEYVKFIEHSIHKTEAMIEGLLQYSRLNTRAEPVTRIDCNRVFEETLDMLQDTLAARNARIRKESALPFIEGDPGHIPLVFYYLLDNATKFHAPATHPEVVVSVARHGDLWRFAVKDNGIGMDPSRQDHAFTIFRRLHSDDEYPGIGIGLALAKKIVEQRHGGRIWIESAHGQGTTVFFTLPPYGANPFT